MNSAGWFRDSNPPINAERLLQSTVPFGMSAHMTLPKLPAADWKATRLSAHGARFCVKTGAVKSAPAYENIDCFQRIENGKVQVRDNRWG